MKATPIFAYGRINAADRHRFIVPPVTAAYRLIVTCVTGDFGAGFTDFVICKDPHGWYIRRFRTGEIMAYKTRFSTRANAAEYLRQLPAGRAGGIHTLIAIREGGEAS